MLEAFTHPNEAEKQWQLLQIVKDKDYLMFPATDDQFAYKY